MRCPGIRKIRSSATVHLNSLSACGFRSLAHVEGIPISDPTILAGHNDGGKSAVLTALAFLLDHHTLTEEDRVCCTFR